MKNTILEDNKLIDLNRFISIRGVHVASDGVPVMCANFDVNWNNSAHIACATLQILLTKNSIF